MQISQKYSLIYVITKLGLLFVYDLETATAVYRNRISPDPIFLTAESAANGGFYAINRRGQETSVLFCVLSLIFVENQDGYRDILKMADNFSAFNQRLKYAHYHPSIPIKSEPRAWWKYAYKVVIDELKKVSGKLSWEQVLKHATLRKK